MLLIRSLAIKMAALYIYIYCSGMSTTRELHSQAGIPRGKANSKSVSFVTFASIIFSERLKT